MYYAGPSCASRLIFLSVLAIYSLGGGNLVHMLGSDHSQQLGAVSYLAIQVYEPKASCISAI